MALVSGAISIVGVGAALIRAKRPWRLPPGRSENRTFSLTPKVSAFATVASNHFLLTDHKRYWISSPGGHWGKPFLGSECVLKVNQNVRNSADDMAFVRFQGLYNQPSTVRFAPVMYEGLRPRAKTRPSQNLSYVTT